MRFFGPVFFMSQHLIGPWWTSRNCLIFFREFAEIFVHEVWLSADNSRKVKTFRGLYRGKACICELFCVKAGFSMVKSVESFDFPRIILRKGMPFHRIILGKSKLSADHTAERHAFPQGNPRKVKTFRKLPCGKFQYTAESQNLTF
jgi:hypothetical protein